MPALAVDNMLELIGGTPLVRLRHLVDASMADVFCKCEQFNPGGSVKDRIALAMIEAAEREGRIKPGESVIVEPTSGNTGIGLALVCAAKGYRLILTMPDNMSLERRALLKAYGAELHLTPAGAGHGGRGRESAEELARENPNYFMPQQFKNPANPEAHRRTTGPEILAQLGDRAPDAFVAGVGTGGTITGVGRVLRASASRTCASSPSSRRRARCCRAARRARTTSRASAPASCPRILDRSVIDEVRTISERDANGPSWRWPSARGCWSASPRAPTVKIALDVARELGPGQDRRDHPVRHGRALFLAPTSTSQ